MIVRDDAEAGAELGALARERAKLGAGLGIVADDHDRTASASGALCKPRVASGLWGVGSYLGGDAALALALLVASAARARVALDLALPSAPGPLRELANELRARDVTLATLEDIMLSYRGARTPEGSSAPSNTDQPFADFVLAALRDRCGLWPSDASSPAADPGEAA